MFLTFSNSRSSLLYTAFCRVAAWSVLSRMFFGMFDNLRTGTSFALWDSRNFSMILEQSHKGYLFLFSPSTTKIGKCSFTFQSAFPGKQRPRRWTPSSCPRTRPARTWTRSWASRRWCWRPWRCRGTCAAGRCSPWLGPRRTWWKRPSWTASSPPVCGSCRSLASRTSPARWSSSAAFGSTFLSTKKPIRNVIYSFHAVQRRLNGIFHAQVSTLRIKKFLKIVPCSVWKLAKKFAVLARLARQGWITFHPMV